jgi:hypothetical protein
MSGVVLMPTAGKFVDASSDPDDVVNDLEALLQHISGLGEALGLYNQYLGLFDAATDDLSTLMMAEKEANGRYQVRSWPQVLLKTCVCLLGPGKHGVVHISNKRAQTTIGSTC